MSDSACHRRSQTRVHRLFLTLCVSVCLAVGLWPRHAPPLPSTRQLVSSWPV